uniref:Uncharacterized protein n=1 Tax=Arundo donax TaxID=35708 RepID=A0A0A9TBC3_ARUDO
MGLMAKFAIAGECWRSAGARGGFSLQCAWEMKRQGCLSAQCMAAE